MRFPPQQKLRSAQDYQRKRSEGMKWESGGFICRLMPSAVTAPSGACRMGVIASRRVGNAVKRNRAKRLFREIFRLNQEHLPANTDVIIIVRSRYDQFPFVDLRKQFLRACHRYVHSLEAGAQKS